MPIKSFRGLMVDNTSETIPLATNTGKIGYRIKKFQVMPKSPTDATAEAVVQVYKTPHAVSDQVNFSDQTLLAACYYNQDSTAANNISDVIIFDSEIFNQDIYITAVEGLGATRMNYYLELEQIVLSSNENTTATLKDIRNTT